MPSKKRDEVWELGEEQILDYKGKTDTLHNHSKSVLEKLHIPFRWRASKVIRVCPKGDLFGLGISNELIAAVYGMMLVCDGHIFKLATKYLEKMREFYEWIKTERLADDFYPSGTSEAMALICNRAAYSILTNNGYFWNRRSKRLRWQTHYKALSYSVNRWPVPNLRLGMCDQSGIDKSHIKLLYQCPATDYFFERVRFTSGAHPQFVNV